MKFQNFEFQEPLAESWLYMAAHLEPCHAGTGCTVSFSERKNNAVVKEEKNPLGEAWL